MKFKTKPWSLLILSIFIFLAIIAFSSNIVFKTRFAKAQAEGCCIVQGVCYENLNPETCEDTFNGTWSEHACSELGQCVYGCCCYDQIGFFGPNITCDARFEFYPNPNGNDNDCNAICSNTTGVIVGKLFIEGNPIQGFATIIAQSDTNTYMATSSFDGAYGIIVERDNYTVTASLNDCVGSRNVEVLEVAKVDINLTCPSQAFFKVNGTVTHNNIGVENFIVKFRNQQDNSVFQTVTTTNGFYSITDIPGGVYDVAAWNDSCSGRLVGVQIDDNKTVDITVTCAEQGCEESCFLVEPCHEVNGYYYEVWNCTQTNCETYLEQRLCAGYCEQNFDCTSQFNNNDFDHYVCYDNTCVDCDADNDGYLIANDSDLGLQCQQQYPASEGFLQGDCNDYNPNIHPGSLELCDRVDNNCDGQVDEGCQNIGVCGDGDLDPGEECDYNHTDNCTNQGLECDFTSCQCVDPSGGLTCDGPICIIPDCCQSPACNQAATGPPEECLPEQQQACGIDISTKINRSGPPEINVSINVSWVFTGDNCDTNSIQSQVLHTYKNLDGELDAVPPISETLTSEARSYLHENLEYNTTYCYNLTVFFNDGSEVSNYTCLNDNGCTDTGLLECYNRGENAAWCSEEDPHSYYSCDDCYKIQSQSCPDNELCFGSGECKPPANCSACNGIFAMYAFLNLTIPYNNVQTLFCNELPGQGVCTLDKTNTIEDAYKSCSEVRSCYDYDSKQACNQDACNITGCEWVDISQSLGIGVCRPQDETLRNCNECNEKPWCNKLVCSYYGNCYWDGDANNLEDGFYSALGLPYPLGKCLNRDQVICRIYDTQQDCEDTQLLNISNYDNHIITPSNDSMHLGLCRWVIINDYGKCIKDADLSNTNEDDCFEAGFFPGDETQNETFRTCFYDYTPPFTTLELPRPGKLSINDIDRLSYIASDEGIGVKETKFGIRSYNCLDNPLSPCNNANVDVYPQQNLLLLRLRIKAIANTFKCKFCNNLSLNLIFYSKDNASNLEVVKNQTILIDAKRPFITISEPNITSYYTGVSWASNLTISFSVDEPSRCNVTLKTIDQSLNLSTFLALNQNLNVTMHYDGLGDNTYYFNVTCNDSVDNQGSNEITIRIRGDRNINNSQPEPITVLNVTNVTISTETANTAECRYYRIQTMQDLQNFENNSWLLQHFSSMPLFESEGQDLYSGYYLFYKNLTNLEPGQVYYYAVVCNFSGTIIPGFRSDDIGFAIDKQPPSTIVKHYLSQEPYDNSTPQEVLNLTLSCNDSGALWPLNMVDYHYNCSKTYYCVEQANPSQNSCLNDDGSPNSTKFLIYNASDVLSFNYQEHKGSTLYYYSVDNGGNVEPVQSIGLNLKSLRLPVLNLTINGRLLPQNFYEMLTINETLPVIKLQSDENVSIVSATLTSLTTGNNIGLEINPLTNPNYPNSYVREFNLTPEHLILDGVYEVSVYVLDTDENIASINGFFNNSISQFKTWILQPHNSLMNITGETPPGAGVNTSNGFTIIVKTEIPANCGYLRSNALGDNLSNAFQISTKLIPLTNENITHQHQGFTLQYEETYYNYTIICKSQNNKFSVLEVFLGFDSSQPIFNFTILNPNPRGFENVIEDPLLLNAFSFELLSNEKVVCWTELTSWDCSNVASIENIAISNLETDTKLWNGYKQSFITTTNALRSLTSHSDDLYDNECTAIYNVYCENLAGLQTTLQKNIIVRLAQIPTIYSLTRSYFGANQPVIINVSTNLHSNCSLTACDGVDIGESFNTDNGYVHYVDISDNSELTLNDGHHYCNVSCMSTFSGYENSTTIGFSIDTTPPSITINDLTYSCNLQTVIINYTATDDVSGIDYVHYEIVNPEGQVIASEDVSATGIIEVTFTNLESDTDYTVTLTAFDNAGNQESVQETFTAIMNTSSECDFTAPALQVWTMPNSSLKARQLFLRCNDATGPAISGCEQFAYYVTEQDVCGIDYESYDNWAQFQEPGQVDITQTIASFDEDVKVCIAVADVNQNLNYTETPVIVKGKYPLINVFVNTSTLTPWINVSSDELVKLTNITVTNIQVPSQVITLEDTDYASQHLLQVTTILFPGMSYELSFTVNDTDNNSFENKTSFTMENPNSIAIWVAQPRHGNNQIPNIGFSQQQSYDIVIETEYNATCRYIGANCNGNLEYCYNLGQGFDFEGWEDNYVKYGFKHKIFNYPKPPLQLVEGQLYAYLIICNESNTGTLLANTFITGFDTTNPIINTTANPNPVTDPNSKTSNFTITSDDKSVCFFNASDSVSNPQNWDFNSDYSTLESYSLLHNVLLTFYNANFGQVYNVDYEITCENLAGLQTITTYLLTVNLSTDLHVTALNNHYFNNVENVLINASTDKQATCKFLFNNQEYYLQTSNNYYHELEGSSLGSLEEGFYQGVISCEMLNYYTPATTSTNFTIDYTSPFVNITSVNYVCSGQELFATITAHDVGENASGLARLCYAVTLNEDQSILVSDCLTIDTDPYENTIAVPFNNLQQDQDYTVSVTVTDKAGNSASDSKTFTAYLNTSPACDVSPPTFSISQEVDSANKQRIVSVNCQEQGVPVSGCNGFAYYVTNESITTCNTSLLDSKIFEEHDYITPDSWPAVIDYVFNEDVNLCIAVFDNNFNVRYSEQPISVNAKFPLASVEVLNTDTLTPVVNVSSDEPVQVLSINITTATGEVIIIQPPQGFATQRLINLPVLYPNMDYDLRIVVSDSDSNYYEILTSFHVETPESIAIWVAQPRHGNNQIPNIGFSQQPSYDIVIETEYEATCKYITRDGCAFYNNIQDCYKFGEEFDIEASDGQVYPYTHKILNYPKPPLQLVEGQLYAYLIICNESNTGTLLANTFITGFDTTQPNINTTANPNPVTDPAMQYSLFNITIDDLAVCSFTADNSVSNPQSFDFNLNYELLESYAHSHGTIIDYSAALLGQYYNVNYEVVCENLAGLQTTTNYNVVVDLNKNITITPVYKHFNKDPDIVIKAVTDKLATCWLDDQEMSTENHYNHSITLQGLSPGTYTSTITCQLLTGFETSSVNIEYVIDMTPPIVNITSFDYNCNGQELTVSFTAQDFGNPASGVSIVHYDLYDENNNVNAQGEFQCYGQETCQDSFTIMFTDLEQNTNYNLVLTVHDMADNTASDAESFTAYISSSPECDTTPPVVSISQEVDSANKQRIVTVGCDDLGMPSSGCVGYAYYVVNVSDICDHSFLVDLLQSGDTHSFEETIALNDDVKLCVAGFDAMGNVGFAQELVPAKFPVEEVLITNTDTLMPDINVTTDEPVRLPSITITALDTGENVTITSQNYLAVNHFFTTPLLWPDTQYLLTVIINDTDGNYYTTSRSFTVTGQTMNIWLAQPRFEHNQIPNVGFARQPNFAVTIEAQYPGGCRWTQNCGDLTIEECYNQIAQPFDSTGSSGSHYPYTYTINNYNLATQEGQPYKNFLLCNLNLGNGNQFYVASFTVGFDSTSPEPVTIAIPNPVTDPSNKKTTMNVTTQDLAICRFETDSSVSNPQSFGFNGYDFSSIESYTKTHITNISYNVQIGQNVNVDYEITCENLAGLESTTHYVVNVDLEQNLTITVNSKPYYNSPTVTINVSTDKLANCWLDNQPMQTLDNYVHWITLEGLSEGSHSSIITCSLTGWPSIQTSKEINYVIDTASPVVNVSSIDYSCNGQSVTIRFAAWDVGEQHSGIERVRYALAGSDGSNIEGVIYNNNFEEPFQGVIQLEFSDLQDNVDYTVTLTAFDRAGNYGSDTDSFTAYISTAAECDVTPPTMNTWQLINPEQRTRSLILNCTDPASQNIASSGCVGYAYYYTTQPITQCDQALLMDELQSGDYVLVNSWPVTVDNFDEDVKVCIAVFDAMNNVAFSNPVSVNAKFASTSINVTNLDMLKPLITVSSDEPVMLSNISITNTQTGQVINVPYNSQFALMHSFNVALYPERSYELTLTVTDTDGNYYTASKSFTTQSLHSLDVWIASPRFEHNQIPNVGFARQPNFAVTIETIYQAECRWTQSCEGFNTYEDCYQQAGLPFDSTGTGGSHYPYTYTINNYNLALEEGVAYDNYLLCNEPTTNTLFYTTFTVGFDSTSPEPVTTAIPNPVTDPSNKKTTMNITTQDLTICKFETDSSVSNPQSFGFNGYDFSSIESYTKTHITDIYYPEAQINHEYNVDYEITCENLAGLQSVTHYSVTVHPTTDVTLTLQYPEYSYSTNVLINATTDKQSLCYIDGYPMQSNDYKHHQAVVVTPGEGVYSSTITCNLLTLPSITVSETAVYVVDLTDPEFTSINIDAGCNLQQLRLTFKAIDLVSGVDHYVFRVYNSSSLVYEGVVNDTPGAEPVEVLLNFNLVEDETYSLQVNAYDKAGRTSFATASTVAHGTSYPECDNIPPNVELFVNTQQEGVEVMVTCQDNAACEGSYYYTQIPINQECSFTLPLNNSWIEQSLQEPLWFDINVEAFKLCVLAFDVNGNYGTASVAIDPSMGIWIVSPENGFAQQPVFDLVVNTTKQAVCKHSKPLFGCALQGFNPEQCFNTAVTFTTTGGYQHLYQSFNAQQQGFVEGEPEQWVIICNDTEGLLHYAFVLLGFDTTPPTITVTANPQVVVDPSSIQSLINISSDDYVACSFAESNTNHQGVFEGGLINDYGKQLFKLIDYSAQPYNINPGDTNNYWFDYSITCDNLAGFETGQVLHVNVHLDPEIHITVNTPTIVTSTPVLLSITTDKQAVCGYKPLTGSVYTPLQTSNGYEHYAWLDLVLDGVYDYNVVCQSQYDVSEASVHFILDTQLPEIVNATIE